MQGSYRFLTIALFVCFGVVAVALVVVAPWGRSGGPAVAFTCVWIALMGWTAHWFLFRVAYELELDGDRLRWRAPLRSGEVALADLTRVSTRGNVGVIAGARHQRVMVLARKGLTGFTAALVAARPDLEVRIGLQVRLAERLPGRSGFREIG
jgi:hypothetical protein